jgi:hypothetical protein
MQNNTNIPDLTVSYRRGKIARLPRAIREQLNVRLDDGQDAAEILPWLAELPEVRQIIAERFDGIPISSQNLSAWRQGGFQEWLLHRDLIDSVAHMREHVEELEDVLGYDEGTGIPHTVADYMMTQLSVRFSRFLSRWDGGADDAQLAALIKIGQFLVKLQQATLRAQREAFEMPKLRRKAEIEYEREIEMAHAFADYCIEQNQKRKEKQNSSMEAEAGKTVTRKTPVRSPHKADQSRSIKVDQGSRANQGARPESTEPAIAEHVEFGQASQHASSS